MVMNILGFSMTVCSELYILYCCLCNNVKNIEIYKRIDYSKIPQECITFYTIDIKKNLYKHSDPDLNIFFNRFIPKSSIHLFNRVYTSLYIIKLRISNQNWEDFSLYTEL